MFAWSNYIMSTPFPCDVSWAARKLVSLLLSPSLIDRLNDACTAAAAAGKVGFGCDGGDFT
jgi:hypothetical protein